MDNDIQQRLMNFLKTTCDHDGMIHFLALTLQEGDDVCPYFGGTELQVDICPKDIRFADEEQWANAPLSWREALTS